jgi:hypothetical protein
MLPDEYDRDFLGFGHGACDKGLLDSDQWHRRYAEALMETEPAKQVSLIAKAERAIFDRYLELCITPAAIEHSIDLQNAVYYLSQLKKKPSTPD